MGITMEEFRALMGVAEEAAEENNEEERDYPNSTYLVVSKVGYLLGVPKRVFDNGQLKPELYQEMDRDKNARIIRNLCIVRTCIEKNFGRISTAMRTEFKSLLSMPEYVDAAAITALSNDGISVIRSNRDLNEYLIELNNLISNRINNCKNLMPIWLKWDYIRALFIMPNGTRTEGVKRAGAEYAEHRGDYPWQVYMNWSRSGLGNILFNDKKFVTLLYEENEDYFEDMSKISDAGNMAKEGIYSFLERSDRTIITVDCENSDPYKLYAMLKNLNQEALLDRVAKIVLYDDVHASSAWEILSEFTALPVERVLIERLKDNKSLADVMLTTGVCREYYSNGIDSYILVSSDSDFWGLINTMPELRFLVAVEDEKVSPAILRALDNSGMTYCYLDDFNTGNSNEIKERALLKELRERLAAEVSFNINAILAEVYEATRADLSKSERAQFYERYVKPMHLVLSDSGEVGIRLGKN